MDAMDMKFEDNSFDVVVEKGTIDALMVCSVSSPHLILILSSVSK